MNNVPTIKEFTCETLEALNRTMQELKVTENQIISISPMQKLKANTFTVEYLVIYKELVEIDFSKLANMQVI